MATNAYVLVTFNTPINEDACSATELKDSFTLKNLTKGTTISITSVTVDDPRYPGKALIQLTNNLDTPQPTDSIQLYYDDGPCNLVRRTNPWDMVPPEVSDFSYNTVANEIIRGTQNSQRPQIISAIALDISGGKLIEITFTAGRDIANNSVADFPSWSISSTSDPSGTSTPTWNFVTKPPHSRGINKLGLITNTGEIQKNGTFTVSYDLHHDGGVADQFDLSLSSVTNFQGTNNVKNLIFSSGSVETETPNQIIFKMKKPAASVNFDVSNNSGGGAWPYNNVANAYKIYTDISQNSGGYENFDISSVETVATSDVSAVQFTFDSFPIKPSSDVGVAWDSGVLADNFRIRDLYLNETFDSVWDPWHASNPSWTDPSSIQITNNIDGITIKTGTNDLSMNQKTGENWDVSENMIISFKRISAGTDISAQLTSGGVAGDFDIQKNGGTTFFS